MVNPLILAYGFSFLTKDILELLERRPDLLNINDNIVRNEGYLISLNKDKANKQ